jgi:hypothetical protein
MEYEKGLSSVVFIRGMDDKQTSIAHLRFNGDHDTLSNAQYIVTACNLYP